MYRLQPYFTYVVTAVLGSVCITPIAANAGVIAKFGEQPSGKVVFNGSTLELTTGGPEIVSFTFGDLAPSYLQGQTILAKFTLVAKAAPGAATEDSQGVVTAPINVVQEVLTAKNAFSFGGHSYAAGTNLLTASGSTADIIGFGGNGFIGGDQVTLTSGILKFGGNLGMSGSWLLPVGSSLSVDPVTHNLNSFTSVQDFQGSFTAAAVPEVKSVVGLCGMMLVGCFFIFRKRHIA